MLATSLKRMNFQAALTFPGDLNTVISDVSMGCFINRRNLKPVIAISLLSIALTGCHHNQLPSCVQGEDAPTPLQLALWDKVPNATQLELAIDGSGSMLGFTGSPKAMTTWKSLLKGVNLAAAAQSLTIQAKRVGSGRSIPVESPLQAADSCFFKGCGGFAQVTSSLDSLWKVPGLAKGTVPLRMVISDLEVNNDPVGGDIAKLVSAIKPHVQEGAVIGLLALQLPFEGKVFNSQGVVIHKGQAKRPVYLLATGPRKQLNTLMQSVKTKAALAGVPTTSMKLTHLEDQANRATLTARSYIDVPKGTVGGDPTIALGGVTYSPAAQPNYQFTRLFPKAKGVILSSSDNKSTQPLQPDPAGLIQLQSIPLPGFTGALNGVSIGGFNISGSDLQIKIDVSPDTSRQAIRAYIARGQMPEDWWLQWNRPTEGSEAPQNQTDGLLLLMTTLGNLMVAPNTTPAAALCLLTIS